MTPDHVPPDPATSDDFQSSVTKRLEAITDQALTHVERTLRVGTHAQKNTLIRQVFPTLMKALTPEESNLELDALKLAMADLMAQVANSLPPGTTSPNEPVPDPQRSEDPGQDHG